MNRSGASAERRHPANIMFLARVEGSVVATKKDVSMSGRKLLLLRPQLVDEKDPTKFRPGANTIVASRRADSLPAVASRSAKNVLKCDNAPEKSPWRSSVPA